MAAGLKRYYLEGSIHFITFSCYRQQQKRSYYFTVCTEKKRVEKLRYMHRNPVKQDWYLALRNGLGAASELT